MSGLSIPAVFAAFVWFRFKANHGAQLRRSLLEAALLLAGITVAGTECLGLMHLLRPVWISLGWVLSAGVALAYLWKELRPASVPRTALRNYFEVFSRPRLFQSWRPFEWVAACLVVMLTGMVAWLSPPTTYDAMTYQLPRMMHWFQQGSLEHYPTANIRQLAYGPGAVYWQIQLWALFDGDHAANLPQWLALIGYGIALSLAIQRFFDRQAIGLAVITGITLPMALLQASSTQSDLQVGCWLMIALIFLLDSDRGDVSSALFAGTAIGLAVVTKPSAGLCVVPIAAWSLWRGIHGRGLVRGMKIASLWVVISLTVCSAHFSRNYRWFGKPLGSDYGTVVESISPALVAANTARWSMLNIPSMTAWRETAAVLSACGIDPNHPAITFLEYKFFPPSRYVVYRLWLPDEDFASYTVSLLLILGLWLAARLSRSANDATIGDPKPHPATPFLGVIFAALVLHVLLLKWQFWGNRLLLPLMLFICPFLVAWSGVWKNRRLRFLTAGLLFVQALFVIFFSINRPLVSLPDSWRYTGATPPLFTATRTEIFHAGYNSEAFPIAQRLTDAVRQYHWKKVGIIVDENYPEYVLWRSLHEAGFDDVGLYYISAKGPASYHAEWPPKVDGQIRATDLVAR